MSQYRTLKKEFETVVRGAVYSLCNFNGKLLAGINGKVNLYKWIAKDDGTYELSSECGYRGSILVLCVRSRGDFVVIGDLMKSISLVAYKPVDGTLDNIAGHYDTMWMQSLEVAFYFIFLCSYRRLCCSFCSIPSCLCPTRCP